MVEVGDQKMGRLMARINFVGWIKIFIIYLFVFAILFSFNLNCHHQTGYSRPEQRRGGNMAAVDKFNSTFGWVVIVIGVVAKKTS
jgi:hypothetical protein